MAKPATKPKVDVPAAKSKSSQPGDNSVTPDQLKSFYRDMLLIRRFEERAGRPTRPMLARQPPRSRISARTRNSQPSAICC